MLVPQQMTEDETELSTTDLQKMRNILLQTLKDLNVHKNKVRSVPSYKQH